MVENIRLTAWSFSERKAFLQKYLRNFDPFVAVHMEQRLDIVSATYNLPRAC